MILCLPRYLGVECCALLALLVILGSTGSAQEDSRDPPGECDKTVYFRCKTSKRCITRSFVCDGEIDCGNNDSSDEDPEICKNSQAYQETRQCEKEQFTCKDKQCIDKIWVCDKISDCPDGSDEDPTICSQQENITCGGLICEHAGHKTCIPNNKTCDGKIDCDGGDDEIQCDSWIPFSKDCKMEYHKFACRDLKRCLPLSKVCDGEDDCLDKSDEGGSCHEKNCDATCPFQCQVTPDGPLCICPPGLTHNVASTKCIDINECSSLEHFAYCDQMCVNTNGSFHCSCKEGYSLVNDTCKAEGEGMLLFATTSEVRLFYLTSKVYDQVAKNVNHSSAVSFDGVFVYWATYAEGEEAIYRSTEIGTNMKMLFTAGLGLVEDLVIDWITTNIYFTDSILQHVAVCNHNGTKCTNLIVEDIEKPRGLVLYSPEGIMFFSDWGSKPRISRVGMDGSNMIAIITENIAWPNGLAIDHGTDLLYWTDAKLETVEYANLDGSNRRMVHNIPVSIPYSIDIFEDTFYWSDMAHNEIKSCHKLTGQNCKSVIRHPKDMILGIHIYHPVLLKNEAENPCKESPCSDLCLLAPKLSHSDHLSYTCACPSGKELSSNKHSCTQSEKSEFLIVASGSQLILIYPQRLGSFHIQEIENHKVTHVSAVVYDSLKDQIVLTDASSKSFTLYDLSTMSVKTVFHVGASSIKDIKFDHVGNNVFWIDGESNSTGLVNLNTFESLTLIKSFGDQTPIALSLHPEEGIMFIALRNSDMTIHIDQFSMDGSMNSRIRRVTEHIIGPTVSLFFDQQSERLFWSDNGSGKMKSIGKANDVHDVREIVYSTIHEIAVTSSEVFWTQMHSNEVFWAGKYGLDFWKHMRVGELNSNLPLKITTAGTVVVDMNDGCHKNNGGCSHACLMLHEKQVCLCPDGLSLDNDGLKCVKKNHCEHDEFACSNGHCLPMHFRCDTKKDCPSGEDEESCDHYTCPMGNFACKDGLQCIDSHLVCDSVKQCRDGSDEFTEECGGSKAICSPVEFHCTSGECIHIAFKCDDKPDCSDESDERGCGSNKCLISEFRCDSGLCIPKSWECDGAEDCGDNSDEHAGCIVARSCNEKEFKCKNSHCVDKKLMCNGDNDCEDGSDEEQCSVKSTTPVRELDVFQCRPEEFLCQSSNSCVSISSRCDGKADCPKGEDEKGCEGCGVEEFQCVTSKVCIPSKWKCDGVNDCSDHSDEQSCPAKTSQTRKDDVCNGIRCGDTKLCVEWKNVCNNHPDCVDGSDEGGHCGKGCDTAGCEVCHETPIGPNCNCPKGYRLQNDGKTCVDINECLLPSTCSQYCSNLIGSYICSCKEEYHLKTDRTSCKAKGPDMEYVFATAADIRFKSKSLTDVDIAFKSPQKLIVKGLDVDMNERIIYWSSELEGILYKNPMSTSKNIEFIRGITRPGKLAYDWVSGMVYFTEKGYLIRMCDFTLKKCATLHELPKDVTVDALRIDGVSRKLYWSETSALGSQDSKATLKSSDLSGAGVTDLVVEGLHRVTDIAVDDLHKTLFFTDSVNDGKIEKLTLQSTNTRNSMFNVEGKPSDISLFEGNLYWLNRMKSGPHSGSIDRNNIITKCGVFGIAYMECEFIRLLPEYSLNTIHRLKISHPALQPKVRNHCTEEKLNCTHLCVTLLDRPICICEDGTQVKPAQLCPPSVGMVPVYKFDVRVDIIPEESQRSIGLGWFVLTFIAIIVAILTPFSYYSYIRNIEHKRPLESVRFENPAYELGAPNQQARTDSLAPGQHQYENPISFHVSSHNQISPMGAGIAVKPTNGTGNNNTMKITRGEESIWPLSREEEHYVDVDEPNLM